MRVITRTIIVFAASIPLVLAAPTLASAAEGTDVTYAFTASGSTVSNAITNNSGSLIHCSTSLAAAPNGVLPPIADVVGPGQTLYESGDVAPGVTMQSVADVPDGSYAVLASCARSETDPALWVSDYPGLGPILALFPTPTFTVQQASTVVTIPAVDTTQPASSVPSIASLLGSSSGPNTDR